MWELKGLVPSLGLGLRRVEPAASQGRDRDRDQGGGTCSIPRAGTGMSQGGSELNVPVQIRKGTCSRRDSSRVIQVVLRLRREN